MRFASSALLFCLSFSSVFSSPIHRLSAVQQIQHDLHNIQLQQKQHAQADIIPCVDIDKSQVSFCR